LSASGQESAPTSTAGSNPASPEVTLVAGGWFSRLGRFLGLHGFIRPAVALTILTWFPLLLLTAAAGHLAGGVTAPFAESIGTHTRFLLALPLLFVADRRVYPQFNNLNEYLCSSGIVSPAVRSQYDAAVLSTIRWRDSIYAELVIVISVVVIAMIGPQLDQTAGSSSWRIVGGDLTAAGWWARAVSIPVFQYLIGRWLWRIVIWTRFLWFVSRLKLDLRATHPDRAGGLTHLGFTQASFDVLCLAASVLLTGIFVQEILYGGTELMSLVPWTVTLTIASQALFVGPLLVFTPRLMHVRWRGLREYSVLGTRYAREFEHKWMHPQPAQRQQGEALVGSADIQSLADLGNSYQAVQEMNGLPFRRTLPIRLFIATLGPMLVMVPIAYPEEYLLLDGLRLILGI
jgi:hypothetical protein